MSETNSDLEKALRALAPAPAALDRDCLMFRAGQASRTRSGLIWKVTSAILGTATVVLAVLLIYRPPSEPRLVFVEVPAPAPKENPIPPPPEKPPTYLEQTPNPVPDRRLPDLAYYRLQQEVNRFGVDALPRLSTNPEPPSIEPPIDRVGKQPSTTVPMQFFPWQ